MTQRKLFTLLAVALSCAFATALAAQTPWIHVEVEELGDEENHVKVNLPLAVVQIAAEAAPGKVLSNGRLDLGHLDEDIEIEDIRRMWQALADTGDGDIVSIENRNQTVRIRREGEQVIIDVTEVENSSEILIRVPVAVVDALLSGDGDELDVRAALEELRDSQPGEIVTVDDEETRVRIWIDERD